MLTSKPTETEKPRRCLECDGNGPDNEDFCYTCGEPSASYRRFIYTEMEANGELDPDIC